MQQKQLMDAESIDRTITRLTYQIIEQNKSLDDVVLIGIRTRGISLARRIRRQIEKLTNVTLPLGELDPRPYRDDRPNEVINENNLMIEITGKEIILVDDVLYTGRTIRAAIDGLMTFGRPCSIQLVVLVDRGHRELPIRPDVVGKNIPTSKNEQVLVHLQEDDGEDAILLAEK